MITIFLIVVMLNLFQFHSPSQNKTIDSLHTALQNAKHDTSRLRLYLTIGDSCKKTAYYMQNRLLNLLTNLARKVHLRNNEKKSV